MMYITILVIMAIIYIAIGNYKKDFSKTSLEKLKSNNNVLKIFIGIIVFITVLNFLCNYTCDYNLYSKSEKQSLQNPFLSRLVSSITSLIGPFGFFVSAQEVDRLYNPKYYNTLDKKNTCDSIEQTLRNPIISKIAAEENQILWFFTGMNYGPVRYSTAEEFDRNLYPDYWRKIDEKNRNINIAKNNK